MPSATGSRQQSTVQGGERFDGSDRRLCAIPLQEGATGIPATLRPQVRDPFRRALNPEQTYCAAARDVKGPSSLEVINETNIETNVGLRDGALGALSLSFF